MSKIAKGRSAKSVVFRGAKEKTYTGLQKSDLRKNRLGRIATKKSHLAGYIKYNNIISWNLSFQQAREEWEPRHAGRDGVRVGHHITSGMSGSEGA